METILVTGATGRVGRLVVDRLVSEGVRIRVMVRTPESAALPAGVDVVQGDLTRPETLDRSLAGISAVFLVWATAGETAAAAIERIAGTGARIVFLTSPHQTPHPFFQQPNAMAALHANLERLINDSGAPRAFLRPGMFASNCLWWWAAQIRAGDVVRWPYGDAASAPIDERNIAAVAVRTLLDEAFDGSDHVLTGPQSLTHREQVAIIADALGRTLQYDEMSPEDARKELKAPPAAVNMLLNAWSASVGLPAFITDSVKTVTGAEPRTFRTWVTDHAASFRG